MSLRVRRGWPLLLAALLGIWLMAAPAVLGFAGLAATTHHVVGPVAAAVCVLAMWGHLRPLRWATLPLGVLLVVLPFWFRAGLHPAANSAVVGLLLPSLAVLDRGGTEGYGGGWSVLWTGAHDATDDERRPA